MSLGVGEIGQPVLSTERVVVLIHDRPFVFAFQSLQYLCNRDVTKDGSRIDYLPCNSTDKLKSLAPGRFESGCHNFLRCPIEIRKGK